MVASQCSCLTACMHWSEKPRGGMRMCEVAWPLVSPSRLIMGNMPTELLGQKSFAFLLSAERLLPKASWPQYPLAPVTLPRCTVSHAG